MKKYIVFALVLSLGIYVSGQSKIGFENNDIILPAGTNVSLGALTIDGATGFIGLGTLTPNAPLEVVGNIHLSGQIQIEGGTPAVGDVLTSDAVGLGTWTLPAGGGFTDVGATIILTNINDNVGIGTSSPNAKLDVGGTPGAVVGGFPSGNLHVTGQGSVANSNSVLTFHSSFNGNTQLAYLGSASSSNNNFTLINRQNASLSFGTNNITQLTISNVGALSTPGDLDLTTGTGGVFQFNDNAIRAGLDAVEYVEMGHGGGNGFINAVGDGGLDLRFEGATLATFTDFGHLHLQTNVDQKHTLKIITANNLNDTGIAWENSGGSFTGTFFRTDVGANRADHIFAAGLNTNIDLLTDSFKIHGGSGVEGKFEVVGALQISSGSPALDRVLTSDVSGNATWQDPASTIFAQLSSSVTQNPADTNPVVITYNTQDNINGLTHSTTVNAGEITIDTAGIYFCLPQPQVGKTQGATGVDFDMFLQVDRGAGFVDEANSNIKLTIKDQDITDVIVSAFTIQLDVGDKIRMMQAVSDSTVGMGLKNTDPVVGPPTIPRTPSIIFTMYRVGGV